MNPAQGKAVTSLKDRKAVSSAQTRIWPSHDPVYQPCSLLIDTTPWLMRLIINMRELCVVSRPDVSQTRRKNGTAARRA